MNGVADMHLDHHNLVLMYLQQWNPRKLSHCAVDGVSVRQPDGLHNLKARRTQKLRDTHGLS